MKSDQVRRGFEGDAAGGGRRSRSLPTVPDSAIHPVSPTPAAGVHGTSPESKMRTGAQVAGRNEAGDGGGEGVRIFPGKAGIFDFQDSSRYKAPGCKIRTCRETKPSRASFKRATLRHIDGEP